MMTERFEKQVAARERASERLSGWRAAVFLISLGFLLFEVYPVAALGAAVYVWLVLRHGRVRESLARFRSRRRLAEVEEATARLDWERIPELPPLPPGLPPYFSDLDLTAGRSLLRLLNRTVSSRGFARLLQAFAGNGVSEEEILRRHRMREVLARHRLLRRRLLVVAGLTEGRIDSEGMLALLKERLLPEGRIVLWVVGGHLLCLAMIFSGVRVVALGAVFLLLLIYRYVASHSQLLTAYHYSVTLDHSLAKLSPLVAVVDRLKRLPGLADLLAPFAVGAEIRRAERITGALGVRQNFLVHLGLNFLLPWDFFWTWRLELLRREMERALPRWLDALAELEWFVSLAEFQEAFPAFTVPEPGGRGIEATGLGHPLLPPDRRVANDVQLGEDVKCYLITGSNMSGKSTFLRSVGVNLCLAKAGSVVCAERFRFARLDVTTSLRVSDSLEDGLSSFYAEVRRLGDILRTAESGRPLLYLIDEIFRGTNNRERLQGSRAYIRKILATEAMGLVATHDLELAQLESENPRLRNFHFKETFEGGKMRFTYRKAPGPCPTTNALKVMEMAGLPVDAPG